VILAGDIGGTRARLALYEEDGTNPEPVKHDVFQSRAYPSLESVVRAFLATGHLEKVRAATFGIAGPVVDQRCVATNFPWVVDARLVARDLGIPKVTLLNDLVALAFGALTVPPERIRVLHGDGLPRQKGGNLAIIAAGTGLGEAALVWDGANFVPLATEGGHCDFAPRNERVWELAVWLERRFGHVSWERVVSGPAFSTLYDFFHEKKGLTDTRENTQHLADAPDRNAAIADLGAAGRSEPATRALELFARLYGAEAGNLALKTLSSAGVYVAGGIAARHADALVRSGFVESFLDKGRFRGLLEQVPLAIVLDSDIGLAGSRRHALEAAASVEATRTPSKLRNTKPRATKPTKKAAKKSAKKSAKKTGKKTAKKRPRPAPAPKKRATARRASRSGGKSR
jgi:glucokinase